MVAVPLPLLSAPGRHPQAAGGRIVNAFLEKMSDTAGQKYAYWRAPGLKLFTGIAGDNFRGALPVGNLLYVVVDDTALAL